MLEAPLSTSMGTEEEWRLIFRNALSVLYLSTYISVNKEKEKEKTINQHLISCRKIKNAAET
jgi:hypothetical protein